MVPLATLCACAIAGILGLDRLCLFHQTYQTMVAKLESERWLLQQCSDAHFFSKMHQHSNLCFQVCLPCLACCVSPVFPILSTLNRPRRSRTTRGWARSCWPCGSSRSRSCCRTCWPACPRGSSPGRGSPGWRACCSSAPPGSHGPPEGPAAGRCAPTSTSRTRERRPRRVKSGVPGRIKAAPGLRRHNRASIALSRHVSQ